MTSDAQTLPLVVLLGDSIRLGYAPLVAQRLSSQSRARVLSHQPNGADTANTLANLAVWAIAPQPRVIHFNCGLHDLKLDRATGAYQVPLDQYRANLQEMRDAVRYLEAIEDRRIARLQEHQPHPEATWGEVFEERGGRWVPKG